MKRWKTWLISLAAVAGLAGGAFYLYRARAAGEPLRCQVCGRQVMRQTEFHLLTTRGELITCCPRCGMHYLLDHPGRVRGARATDYGSGRQLNAQSAFYDEGGAAQYCTRHQPELQRSPRGERQRTYDRCLPVMVAFASRAEAEAYRRRFGGRILTWTEALASVRAH